MEIKINKDLNDLLDGYAEEMTSTLQELIRFRSVVGDVDESRDRAPYGEEIQAAFDYVMKLGADRGFECLNLENRAGEMNFGEGEKSVGVICHLDVVPEGEGWTYPPYGGVVDNGNIYGRGAVDDKGCFVASFYACLALKESGLPLRYRVKQIVGTNEETGSFPCIQYYKKHTKDMPVRGIVPDSWFPAAFAEKGIVSYDFTRKCRGAGNGAVDGTELRITELSGGEAYNVVAPFASASFTGSPERIAEVRAAVLSAEAEDGERFDGRVELTEIDGGLRVRTVGKSAHASTPEIGINAISLLLRILEKISFEPMDLCHTLRVLSEQIGRDSDGRGLGIDCCDHSGPLTNNVGVLSYKDDVLTVKMNIRCPVTTTIEDLTEKLDRAAGRAGMENSVVLYNPHFYMDPEDELIRMLVEVYRTMTGDRTSKPRSHGGGSYARILKNFVPFGPSIEGEELSFHKQDEHISCERLLLLSKIYAQALYQMAK
ncbi:Sapep family Mn(2+)-dependent dipeptidase [Bacilliculturomica massiliensis]|uniref:Sapep family Mn(2+)-dependent dipeptidase n=1 Tax=Bacilliculturomica massiliensis TaxID=1917867 RepID=UPI00103191CF|nr:Sapep family Mn(2+)-dependent dipeptidase [Bacilliculturomica massiliensis]